MTQRCCRKAPLLRCELHRFVEQFYLSLFAHFLSLLHVFCDVLKRRGKTAFFRWVQTWRPAPFAV